MKLLVAPQLMRAVVTTVLAPYFKRMGNWIARSDWFATNTDASVMEEDVAATSFSKKMLCLFRWLQWLIGEGIATQRISFPSLLILSHIFLNPFRLLSWLWSPWHIQGFEWGEWAFLHEDGS